MPDWQKTRVPFQSKISGLLNISKERQLQLFCYAAVHTEELITGKSLKEECNSKLIEASTISF
jgi:hypothetical protein